MALTPKEAFEAVKKLWPEATRIIQSKGRYWRAPGICVSIEYSIDHAAGIDWGTTTEYPLPEPKWRDARPEDVKADRLEARFKNTQDRDWKTCFLAGYSNLATRGRMFESSHGTWFDECQVRDEA